MSSYPHLLSPLRVGSLTLPHRVIMGSMHTGLEEVPGGEHEHPQVHEIVNFHLKVMGIRASLSSRARTSRVMASPFRSEDPP